MTCPTTRDRLRCDTVPVARCRAHKAAPEPPVGSGRTHRRPSSRGRRWVPFAGLFAFACLAVCAYAWPVAGPWVVVWLVGVLA